MMLQNSSIRDLVEVHTHILCCYFVSVFAHELFGKFSIDLSHLGICTTKATPDFPRLSFSSVLLRKVGLPLNICASGLFYFIPSAVHSVFLQIGKKQLYFLLPNIRFRFYLLRTLKLLWLIRYCIQGN